MLVPPNTRHAITNSRASSATVLGMAMIPATDLTTVEPQQGASDARLLSMYDPRRVGTRDTWDRHVNVDGLVAGVGEARFGPCAAVTQTQVSVTHFTLGPGEAIPAHQIEGIELLAVNSGGFEVTLLDSIQLATPAVSPAAGGNPPWGSGHGFVFSPPSAPPVRNAGPLPLGLIGVALQTTGGTSCAVAPVDS